MQTILIDILLVILGVLGGRLIFSSLYKPTTTLAKGASYAFGGALAIVFYLTWAKTGMDPVQLTICATIPDTPVCIEKRIQGRPPLARPVEAASAPVHTPLLPASVASNSPRAASAPLSVPLPAVAQDNRTPKTTEKLQPTREQLDAIAKARKVVASNPNDADAQHELGDALLAAGDVEEAISAYRRATRLPPVQVGMAYHYRDLAEALEAAGRLDEAVEALKTAYTKWPMRSEKFCGGIEADQMLRLLRKKGDVPSAIAFYEPLYLKDSQRDDCRKVYEALLAANLQRSQSK